MWDTWTPTCERGMDIGEVIVGKYIDKKEDEMLGADITLYYTWLLCFFDIWKSNKKKDSDVNISIIFMCCGISKYSVEASISSFHLEVTSQHISEARRSPTETGKHILQWSLFQFSMSCTWMNYIKVLEMIHCENGQN